MAIDMELMRRKLASLRGEGIKNENSVWFKPDEGDTDIRIIPTKDGDPLKEMFFHYNVGDHKGGVLCPKRNFEMSALFANSPPSCGAKGSITAMRKARSLLSLYSFEPDTSHQS